MVEIALLALFALFEAKVMRLRERWHNGRQPLRDKKPYQVKEVFSVFSQYGKKGRIKKLFPSVATCTVVAYDCLNKTSKGQSFTLYGVFFREIPVVGKVYTAKRKKKLARIFFEEKILEKKN